MWWMLSLRNDVAIARLTKRLWQVFPCRECKDMNKMSDTGWDNSYLGGGKGGGGGSGWRFNLRIRSVPGNNTLPRTISAMMQPTDQTSTESEMTTTELACRTDNQTGNKTVKGWRWKGEIIIHKTRWCACKVTQAIRDTGRPACIWGQCLCHSCVSLHEYTACYQI